MILVCGGLADKVTELVCARLNDLGFPYRLLDTGVYPDGFRVCARWHGACPAGYLAGSGWRLDFSELTGVFARYMGVEGRRLPPGVDERQAPALFAEHDSGLSLVFEHLPCAVVNRVDAGMSNHSKTYQAQLVRRCGLLTPPTLVTSDPGAVRPFLEEHEGQVVYKSLSGIRSVVRRVGKDHLARLPLLRDAPAQFQAFIPGENVRVHTVGGRLFPTRILTEAVDYRYARREGFDVDMEPAELPPPVAAACLRLARRLGLLLAGIDLKVTPEGEYYCFEVNPSPAFLYYEQATLQPISEAIAELLHFGPSTAAPDHEDAPAAGVGGVPRLTPRPGDPSRTVPRQTTRYLTLSPETRS